MEKATKSAGELMILYKEAKTAGVDVSSTDERCLAEFNKMREDFSAGDSFGRYINRTYGKGVGESDIRSIILSQVTVGDYIKSVGEEKADEIVKQNANSVTVDKNDTEKIIKGDYI